MGEVWVENRFKTCESYLKKVVTESIDKEFISETGRYDVQGLQVFLTKVMGLKDEEKMEA